MRERFNHRLVPLAAMLFLFALAAQAQKYGPPFPRDGVKLSQESECFAIWDVTFDERKPTGMDELPLDQVTVFLRAGALKISKSDGTWTIEQERLGSIRFESKGIIESEESLSEFPSRAIDFQLKDLVPPKYPITLGVPDQLPRPGADQLFENERVVVYDQTFRPGAPAPRHQHYGLTAGVFLVGGKTLVIWDPDENGVQRPNQVNTVEPGSIINHHGLLKVPHREAQLEGEPRVIYIKLK